MKIVTINAGLRHDHKLKSAVIQGEVAHVDQFVPVANPNRQRAKKQIQLRAEPPLLKIADPEQFDRSVL